MKYPNITAHFDELLEKQRKGWRGPATYAKDMADFKDAIWVAVSDTAGSYEVDEEWIGVKRDGDLVWAYASGCSCWDGDYDLKPVKDLKTMELVHNSIVPEKWEEAIQKFEGSLSVIEL